MPDFGLIKSFGIDNGELDGLRPKDCFVLGYELAIVDEQVKLPDGFSRYIHVENRERIEQSCRDADRDFHLKWLEGDSSESWLWLEVSPAHG